MLVIVSSTITPRCWTSPHTALYHYPQYWASQIISAICGVSSNITLTTELNYALFESEESYMKSMPVGLIDEAQNFSSGRTPMTIQSSWATLPKIPGGLL